MIADVKHLLHDRRVLRVLAACHDQPTAEKMNALACAYQADASVSVYASIQGSAVRGVIAVRAVPESKIEIIGIAANEACRRTGTGTALIHHIREQFPGQPLFAETDDDAVGFYRRCGFNIVSLGEKYPGVIRYLCTLGEKTADVYSGL